MTMSYSAWLTNAISLLTVDVHFLALLWERHRGSGFTLVAHTLTVIRRFLRGQGSTTNHVNNSRANER